MPRGTSEVVARIANRFHVAAPPAGADRSTGGLVDEWVESQPKDFRTMKAPPSCPQCAAKARNHAQRFCEFCGHELPGADSAPQPSASDAQVIARLAAVEQSPAFARLGSHEPRAASRSEGMVFTSILLVLWLGAGLIVTFGFAAVSGGLALIPLAIMGLGSFILVGKLLGHSRRRNAPMERIAAQVIDKRTLVEGRDSSTTTSYFATLANRRGGRREFAVEAQTYALLSPGDAGMAFVRSELLLEFRRIDV